MNIKVRNLTLSALYCAFAVISIYLASIFPTGQLGLTAIASLFVAAVVIEAGISYSISVYIVTSFISILIVPYRVTAFLFILFFGYYPIFKSLIEKLSIVVVQFLAKFLVFNVSLTAIWFLFSELFFASFNVSEDRHFILLVLIYVCGNVIFLLYDYGFSKLIWFYINRISSSRIKKE